jgi:voltage-gated potassium channel
MEMGKESSYALAKRRVFEVIQGSPGNKIRASTVFDWCMITLIILNVILIFLDTFKEFPPSAHKIFFYIEVFSVTVFSIEYILRLWTADRLYPEIPPWKARIKYVFSFMAIVDLLAVLPFYLPLFIPMDLRVLRMLRLLRLLRLLKINRYTGALSTVGIVIKRKAPQLLSSMLVVLVLMIVASLIMYGIEYDAQPGVFENALSGIWWAVATVTTVGYGDIYPITILGKILGSLIALLGVGLVAVPTGILSAGFMEDTSQTKESAQEDKKRFCPYCGKNIER